MPAPIEEGFTPQLQYCEPVIGGYIVVVMDVENEDSSDEDDG